MVGPNQTGNLVRSMVRLPGTGFNHQLESQVLDICRLSNSYRSSVVIPHSLSYLGVNTAADNGEEIRTGGKKRKFSSSSPQPPLKRIRSQMVVAGHGSNRLIFILSPLPQMDDLPPFSLHDASLPQLKQEWKRLREENELLEKTLSTFKSVCSRILKKR